MPKKKKIHTANAAQFYALLRNLEIMIKYARKHTEIYKNIENKIDADFIYRVVTGKINKADRLCKKIRKAQEITEI